MRTLIILRGPRESGRKTFLQDAGLWPWLIDQDAVESLFDETVMTARGKIAADPVQRRRSRQRMMGLIQEKMARGALIVFRPGDDDLPCRKGKPTGADETSADVIALARRYRYRIRIVDFSQTQTPSALAARRQAIGLSGDAQQMARLLTHLQQRIGLPEGKDITWHFPQDISGRIDTLIEPDPIDLRDYANLVVIGDIHGCIQTLAHLTDNHTIRPDTAYVFLGDYINKGPDSGAVLQALIRHYLPQPNCHFLTGNHETALEDWARGDPVRKKVFLDSSLASIEAAGITRTDASAFLGRCHDAAWLLWNNTRILATHGGMAQPPTALGRLAGMHYRYGTMGPEFDVDSAWEDYIRAAAPGAGLVQVHGHRNPRSLPIRAGLGSYNLEGGVDCGCSLRAVLFSPQSGVFAGRPIEIANRDIPGRQAA